MNVLKDIYGLFVAIFTLLIGGSIFIIVAFIGIIYTFIKHIIKLDYSIKLQLSPIIRSITLVFDGMANACAGELLNDVFGHSNIKYGKWYQTISSVTGLRLVFDYKDNTFRKILDKILGEKHCEEAITEEEFFYYKNRNKI